MSFSRLTWTGEYAGSSVTRWSSRRSEVDSIMAGELDWSVFIGKLVFVKMPILPSTSAHPRFVGHFPRSNFEQASHEDKQAGVFGRSCLIIVLVRQQFHLQAVDVHAQAPTQLLEEAFVKETLEQLRVLQWQIHEFILAGDPEMDVNPL